MLIEQTQYQHWTGAYRCVVGESELIAITQIGPRIMSLRCGGGENVLYEDRTGFGLDQWKLYGGHRFTTAPETAQSYEPDNTPCDVAVEDGRLRILQRPQCGGLQKILEIGPCGESGFEVRHVLRNTGNLLWWGAAWTLTCVRPTGNLVAAWGAGSDRWRYNMVRYWSRLGDCHGATDSPQWRPADEVFIVEPTGESGKIGLFADRGWLALARSGRNLLQTLPADRVGIALPGRRLQHRGVHLPRFPGDGDAGASTNPPSRRGDVAHRVLADRSRDVHERSVSGDRPPRSAHAAVPLRTMPEGP